MRRIALLLLAALAASAQTPRRALVLDHELNPPDFSNQLIRRVAASGFSVDFRQYAPVITRSDLQSYSLLVLLSSAGGIGSGLQLEEAAIPALTAYVKGGGALILGVPSDPEAFPQLGVYNKLLTSLGAGIRVEPAIVNDDTHKALSVMFPQPVYRDAAAKTDLVLDRGTILTLSPPAVALAESWETAYAVEGLGRGRVKGFENRGAMPVAAMASCGKGKVFVTGRFNLNPDGFNGRVGVQPMATLDWIPQTARFLTTAIERVAGGAQPLAAIPAEAAALPSAPPSESGNIAYAPGTAPDRAVDRRQYRASIRRDLYGEYLDHGMRAAWGDIDHDDEWLRKLAEGFKTSGINYVWGISWPERFVSPQFNEEQRRKLRHAWDTFASLLDGSKVGWTIGFNYPGAGFDRNRYERSRRADGQVVEALSPLDLRLWNEMIIPQLEAVARFAKDHPSVKGATIDYEMYGWEPVIFYPEGYGFEDVAFQAFLRAAEGHVPASTLRDAAGIQPAVRYPWLRDRGLLPLYFLLLESESEKLGRVIRQRIHAIHPNFIFGAYQAGFPYSWFYRGLMRGLSTPEMPMLWMSFQTLSATDMDRFWGRGQHMLNATALMLGTFPIAEWKNAMLAGRKYHDGYWLNRYNWLIEDAKGKTSIEIPNGTREEAWKALTEGNRLLDEFERKARSR